MKPNKETTRTHSKTRSKISEKPTQNVSKPMNTTLKQFKHLRKPTSTQRLLRAPPLSPALHGIARLGGALRAIALVAQRLVSVADLRSVLGKVSLAKEFVKRVFSKVFFSRKFGFPMVFGARNDETEKLLVIY